MSGAWRSAGIVAVLALAVGFVYAPVRSFPFVVYDDKALVSENPMVTGGLTVEGVRRAFSEAHVGNYVPLTWLSHMLDVQLFGLDAGGHHLVNVLLHLGATLLLFGAFRRMTGDLWPSAFVAAVFAVHPLHVESVAWVAERRDVLSGFCFALTLFVYTGWAPRERRSVAGGAALIASAGLGLLAKPTLVTLPFVLLLLDYWPLARGPEGAVRLVREKWPLFVLVALVAGATLVSQGGEGAVASLAQVPVSARLANALTSAVAYLGRTAWPTGLSVFYPFDLEPPPWRTAAAALLLAAATAGALWQVRRRPYLLVGWLWYLGMLVPVIGMVQVGSQGMADRYTYLPMIGLTLAAAWGARELARWPNVRHAVAGFATAWLLACAFLARAQVDVWRDSITLFEHARTVVGEDPVVLVNLAEAYDDAGETQRAIALYRQGLEGFPHARQARTRLGILLAESGDAGDAALELQRALRIHPEEPGTRLALGRLALRTDQLDQAAVLLEEERALAPRDARVPFHLGELHADAGRPDAAARAFAEAFTLDPGLEVAPVRDRSPRVALALARALDAAARPDEARSWGRRALTLARLGDDDASASQASAWLAEHPGE